MSSACLNFPAARVPECAAHVQDGGELGRPHEVDGLARMDESHAVATHEDSFAHRHGALVEAPNF
jgi:hypothetical protein